MKRTLIAAALVLAAAGPSFAADLPPPMMPRAPAAYIPSTAPVYNWTGFYIGGNGGYGFATGNPTLGVGPFAIGGSNGALDGFVAGGQAGFNWQINSLVLGIEGDFDWSGQKASNTFTCGFAACPLNGNSNIRWFSTLRGRVGYAVNRVLFYGTGGVAWVNANQSTTSSVTGLTWASQSQTAIGWTAGAGVEVALAEHWTARIEYLYIQAKPQWSGAVPAGTFAGTPVTVSTTLQDSLVRAGVNFKF